MSVFSRCFASRQRVQVENTLETETVAGKLDALSHRTCGQSSNIFGEMITKRYINIENGLISEFCKATRVFFFFFSMNTRV